MITEFGGSPTEMCSEFIEQLIDYMAANDEYIGWSAWAAGPRMFTLLFRLKDPRTEVLSSELLSVWGV